MSTQNSGHLVKAIYREQGFGKSIMGWNSPGRGERLCMDNTAGPRPDSGPRRHFKAGGPFAQVFFLALWSHFTSYLQKRSARELGPKPVHAFSGASNGARLFLHCGQVQKTQLQAGAVFCTYSDHLPTGQFQHYFFSFPGSLTSSAIGSSF